MAGAAALQKFAASAHHSSACDKRSLGTARTTDRISKSRLKMVDRSPTQTQQSSNPLTRSRHCGGDGCLYCRLGWVQQRRTYRRPVVCRERTGTHKHPRTACSVTDGSSVLEGASQQAREGPHGQCDGSRISESSRRDEISEIARHSSRSMGVGVNRDLYITAEHVPGKENVRADYNSRHFSPATEWTLDRHTFLGLQATFPRLMKGVDLFASDISTTHEGGGSVRVPNKLRATSVCVLASRARGNRDRCVHNELEQVGSAIRFSPVHASRTNSKESARRQSSPASRSSDLGHSSLVPSPAGDAGRRTSVTTSPQQSPDTARVRDASPRGHKNATSRLACLRSQHDMYGISPEVSKILLASWRAGTQKLYASAWDKWSGWCDQRHIHPVSAPLNKVLDFLISLYDKGFQYRTINVYRSAISTTHLPLEGQPLGSHPLMAKTVLQEAGIDTSRFTGHSTRGASVSAAARQGVSTKDILAAANWSTASTFRNSTTDRWGQLHSEETSWPQQLQISPEVFCLPDIRGNAVDKYKLSKPSDGQFSTSSGTTHPERASARWSCKTLDWCACAGRVTLQLWAIPTRVYTGVDRLNHLKYSVCLTTRDAETTTPVHH
ncbi:hypothetical protein Bbelb_247030 [Branchiostoma belcheri]|nr:hypothetical protein Bbelb_247030 [Branchiostoma belcheri]